jgi:hypothetical protein
MRDRIAAGAREAGRDFADIALAYHIEIRIDGTADPRPSVVSGAADAVVVRLAGFARLGFTSFSLAPFGQDQAAQIEQLARDVLPAVRALTG